MKKKLDTRFPAARIKKIMQADEEVGKIAAATPVLMSKALEIFLQHLVDKTYEVTMGKGGKTIATNHLKSCIYNNSIFDFLREVAARAPEPTGDGDAETNCRSPEEDEEGLGDCKPSQAVGAPVRKLKGEEAAAGKKRGGQKRNGDRSCCARNGRKTPKLESEHEETVYDSSPRRESSIAVKAEKRQAVKVKVEKTTTEAKIEPVDEREDKEVSLCTAPKAEPVDENPGPSDEVLGGREDSVQRIPKDFDLNVGLDEMACDEGLVENGNEAVNGVYDEKPAEDFCTRDPDLRKEQTDSAQDTANAADDEVPCKGEELLRRGRGLEGKSIGKSAGSYQNVHYDEDDYDCEDNEGG